MAIRHPLRLVKLYKRALRAKRSFSQLEDRLFSIPARCGSFTADLRHYQSHFMPEFQSGSLDGLDRFIRKQNPFPDYFFGPYPYHMMIEPSEQPFAHLYSARSWENLQSVNYQKWHVETACRAPTTTTTTTTTVGTTTTIGTTGTTVGKTTVVQAVAASQPAASLNSSPAPSNTSDASDTPTPELSKEERVAYIAKSLAVTLPQFFVKMHNYNLYHKDVVFENRIRNVTSQGINDYSLQLTKYKTLAHLLYSHVNMEIIKITEHPDDGSVRVRWRVNAVGGMLPFVTFWRFFSKKGRKGMLEKIDGFSIFYVGQDGLIYKHVADKMIPDDDKPAVEDVKVKLAKLAGVMGFILPGTAAGGMLEDL